MPLTGGGLIGSYSATTGGGGTSPGANLAASQGIRGFATSFSGITTSSFAHNLDSENVVVEFRDTNGNLLVPDNWQSLNPNSIEVEFNTPQNGDVTILAYIPSGIPGAAGVSLVEGLSGIIDLDSPDGSINISTSGQVINLEVASPNTACATRSFTTASGTNFVVEHGLGTQNFVFQVWDTSITPEESLTPDNVSPSGNDHAVIEFNTPADGRIVFVACGGMGSSDTGNGVGFPTASGALLQQLATDVTSLSGQVATLNSQLAQVSGLATSGAFPAASGAIVDQLAQDISTVSGQLDALPLGVTTLNTLEGDVSLTSTNGSVAIQVNAPDEIDFSFNQVVSGIITGDSFTEFFDTASGTLFVVQHDLGVENFTYNLWNTDPTPNQSVEPVNIAPSGFNHVIVQLASAMNGKLVLTNGGSDSGLIPVDKRQVVGDIVPATSGQHALGSEQLPMASVAADSIKRSNEEVALAIHTPVGMVTPFAGSSAPRGWLICDGSGVSRSQYADLFSVIGTTYGVGDGVTTFNIPDLRARMAVGVNNNTLSNSGVFDSSRTQKDVGDSGGAETHILTSNELPAHDHIQRQGNTAGIGSGPAPGTFGTNINNSSVTTASVGADQPHNNLPPFLTMNYIIRY